MFGYRKAKMMNEIVDIVTPSQEPILFNVHNAREEVVYSVRGFTKQDLEKPKVVDVNIPGGALVLNEERNKIGEIKNKYRQIWKSDIKEKRLNAIAKVKKETNWKLRVLNEKYISENKEREIREKNMRSGEETVDSKMQAGAKNLLFFSESLKKEVEKKSNKIKDPLRRSARIAEITRRKSLRKTK